MDKKKYYQILGVTENASRDDIQAAYTSGVEKWKAASASEDPVYSEKKRHQLQEAYDVLILGMDENGRFPSEEAEKTTMEKVLGVEKGYKPFYKRGFIYTEKPKKDVRFVQYLFVGAAGVVIISALLMVIDMLKGMFWQ